MASSRIQAVERLAHDGQFFGCCIDVDLARAHIELDRGNFAEAEQLFRDCLIRARWHQVHASKYGLVMCIHAQRPTDPEALDIARGEVSPGNNWAPAYPVDAISNLIAAELLIERQSLDEAATILRPAYEWIHQKTFPDGYMTGLADGAQGKLLAAQGKLEEAERQLLASLENLRKSRGEHHWLTRKARSPCRLLSAEPARRRCRTLCRAAGRRFAGSRRSAIVAVGSSATLLPSIRLHCAAEVDHHVRPRADH